MITRTQAAMVLERVQLEPEGAISRQAALGGLRAFASFARPGGLLFPSRATLAQRAGFSVRTAQRWLNWARAAGVIERISWRWVYGKRIPCYRIAWRHLWKLLPSAARGLINASSAGRQSGTQALERAKQNLRAEFAERSRAAGLRSIEGKLHRAQSRLATTGAQAGEARMNALRADLNRRWRQAALSNPELFPGSARNVAGFVPAHQ